MNPRVKQIALTSGVLLISFILIALGFFGFSLFIGLLFICILWGLYFFLMTR